MCYNTDSTSIRPPTGGKGVSMVLTGYAPERVFYYFEQLSRIPHGSGNMDAIIKYCQQSLFSDK